jgi:hypothetical protein
VTSSGLPVRGSSPKDHITASNSVRRRSSSLILEHSKIIPRIKLKRESLGWIFLKTVCLAVFLLGAIAITGITQTNFSIEWAYRKGEIPMISCPSVTFQIGPTDVIDGTHCKLYFTTNNPATLKSIDNRIVTTDGGYFGTVVYAVTCEVAAGLVNPSTCKFDGSGDTYPDLNSPCQFSVSPVCDAAGDVTVGRVITLAGMTMMSGILCLVFFLVSVVGWFYQTQTLTPLRQRRLDGSRGPADTSAKEMSKIVDREWSQMDYEQSVVRSSSRQPNSKRSLNTSPKGFPSLVAETGNLKSSQSLSGPRELFMSINWRNKVVKCLGSEAKARRRVALTLVKIRTCSIVGFIFFALFVGVAQLVLFALPLNYNSSTPRSVFSVLIYNQNLIRQAATSSITWIDFCAVGDLVLESIGLFCSWLFVIQWPKLPVKVPHLVKIRNGIRRGVDTDFGQAAADGAIYSESICAVILARENCSSESRRQSLVKRIQNLLTMFPPDSIFVVDSNPHSSVPVDNTWLTVNSISPLIRYCFVPDCDSKVFALYWFNTVWLPFLARSGHSQAFTHLLVLSSPDDESPLPNIPMDVAIPRENIALNMDNLRALHMPITAVSSSPSSCFLVPCQDFDFKLRAIRRITESKMGSCMEAEILTSTVWERDALYVATKSNRTTDNSPLQQLKTSLEVIKLRGRSHIKSNPYSFVQVTVPCSFSGLVSYRLRTGYAGEVIKAGVALVELLSVFSLCSTFSWAIKPFLLLGTLVPSLCQLVRPFVIGTLIFRDPISIACLFVGAGVLIMGQEILLLIIFSSRPDLRQKWSLAPVILYPFYRFLICWIIELPALFDYILGGCVRDSTLRPEKRFKELHDAPACPPSPIVNWFTVWKTEDDMATETGDNEDSVIDEDSLFSGFSPSRRRL